MAEVQPLPYLPKNKIVAVAPLTVRSTKNLAYMKIQQKNDR
jgi:hypothetical protein